MRHSFSAKTKYFVLGCLFFTFGALMLPKNAAACCICTRDTALPLLRNTWPDTFQHSANRILTEFTEHRVYFVTVFWEDNILPAMQLMADQLTAVSLMQTQIFGTFLDAKHQLETQQSIQKIAARAHKDYHPSVGMCEFGSSVKSLAASERRSEYNAIVMAQRSQDRALGSANTSASTGSDFDQESRVRQFRKTFCNPRDNNSGLAFMCDHDQNYNGGDSGAEDKARMNKDIDFVRTVDGEWTLDIDFSDTELTNDEEEVLALASNLYGHNVFPRPPARSLEDSPNLDITSMQGFYMDARSVIAKRSVAENSFNAITAMKASGAPGSKDYIKAVLKELGVDDENGPPADLEAMLGENPSYYAQMEVLTKKIYQNPDFYTNLYDKPANVTRKQVALQAIGLMQKFDLFKSYLRNEASLSVLLELAVMDLQDEVENEMGRLTGFGEKANP